MGNWNNRMVGLEISKRNRLVFDSGSVLGYHKGIIRFKKSSPKSNLYRSHHSIVDNTSVVPLA